MVKLKPVVKHKYILKPIGVLLYYKLQVPSKGSNTIVLQTTIVSKKLNTIVLQTTIAFKEI